MAAMKQEEHRLVSPVDALQVESVRAYAPHHRRVVAGVLCVGRTAVKWHATYAADIVACAWEPGGGRATAVLSSGAGLERQR